jgi:hypothetical protein
VVVRALIALTKPRIIELLLVTTVPAMLLAQRGVPSIRLVLVTLVGGTLAAGSANTINCYIDRDIDAVMKRTSRRPLVVNGHGTIRPWEALAWGIALGAGATLLLGLMANWLSAALADAAILFYIFVYTLLLKRRSPANIVIGGAAGCFPVLVGWAAVTGTVSLPAVVLFAVIFLWTPPHFWALAMKFRKDYAPPTCRCCRWWRRPPRSHGRSSGTPTPWWRPRWPWSRTRAGSTACWPPPSAPGSWSRRTGCTPGYRIRPGRQATPGPRAPRCGCSTCRSRT